MDKVQKIQIDNIQMDFISEEMLQALKGGIAAVEKSENDKPKDGDGSKYVCCIKIGKLR